MVRNGTTILIPRWGFLPSAKRPAGKRQVNEIGLPTRAAAGKTGAGEPPKADPRKDNMPHQDQLPITALETGEEGIIHAISGGNALISRLAGMGIVLNAKIRFLQASG